MGFPYALRAGCYSPKPTVIGMVYKIEARRIGGLGLRSVLPVIIPEAFGAADRQIVVQRSGGNRADRADFRDNARRRGQGAVFSGVERVLKLCT